MGAFLKPSAVPSTSWGSRIFDEIQPSYLRAVPRLRTGRLRPRVADAAAARVLDADALAVLGAVDDLDDVVQVQHAELLAVELDARAHRAAVLADDAELLADARRGLLPVVGHVLARHLRRVLDEAQLVAQVDLLVRVHAPFADFAAALHCGRHLFGAGAGVLRVSRKASYTQPTRSAHFA